MNQLRGEIGHDEDVTERQGVIIISFRGIMVLRMYM